MNQNLTYQIALTKIPMVGLWTARLLIRTCGSAEAVFSENKKTLAKIPRISSSIVNNIIAADPEALSAADLSFITEHKISPLFFTDPEYPSRLKPFADSPMILYYKGNANLNADRIVSIVGTRTPTDIGKVHCQEIVEGLSKYNVLIISGLAYGIDVTAHHKCLSLRIPTVGVLGHGMSQIYPAAHKPIAARMLEQGGILTQFGPDKGPEREHFPMRNAVVAGMSDAVIVVETARKGGSMITAELANGYNKDVFAVPGRLNDRFSKGCNHLIKSHKAQLIESSEDIAYVMRWSQENKTKQGQTALFPELDPNEKNILNLIGETNQINIDQLAYQAKLSSSEMATLILQLEFKGLIKTLPGKRFVLTP
jgi:DNA protecting protein DprA